MEVQQCNVLVEFHSVLHHLYLKHLQGCIEVQWGGVRLYSQVLLSLVILFF
jgi:hypothetical protein